MSSSSPENTSMALFCDFENVALGVRDAHHGKFDIKRVLERLLLKGSIVVKKAYCDWDRYKQFKGTMHEANFELIEIPHVRQSGKNSADIRLVVDALDLCYTKSHVDTFVIISGDSDFSPLVSKLRENAKQVIGVGVKQSTSDLLIANCDEFIFYDDLVREGQHRMSSSRHDFHEPAGASRQPRGDDGRRGGTGHAAPGQGQPHPAKEDPEARRLKAIDLAMETLEALGSDRSDGGKLRTSVLKDAIKRRRPDFNETYFGFRSFGALLEEAQARGLLEIVRDEKGNGYVQRALQPMTRPEPRPEPRRDRRPHDEHAPVAIPPRPPESLDAPPMPSSLALPDAAASAAESGPDNARPSTASLEDIPRPTPEVPSMPAAESGTRRKPRGRRTSTASPAPLEASLPLESTAAPAPSSNWQESTEPTAAPAVAEADDASPPETEMDAPLRPAAKRSTSRKPRSATSSRSSSRRTRKPADEPQ